MKKDRNSFFSQYGVNAYNTNQPFMYPNMGPIPSNMSAQSSMNVQTGYPAYQYTQDTQDIDARLSKIERELQRIDTRLNKLESTTANTNIANTDYNFANSMYMV